MIVHVGQIATVSHFRLVSSKLPFNFAIFPVLYSLVQTRWISWVRVELYKRTQLIHLVCTKLYDQYAKDFSKNIHPWFKTLSAWKIIPGTGLPLILRFLFITLKMRWNWNKISIYCGSSSRNFLQNCAEWTILYFQIQLHQLCKTAGYFRKTYSSYFPFYQKTRRKVLKVELKINLKLSKKRLVLMGNPVQDNIKWTNICFRFQKLENYLFHSLTWLLQFYSQAVTR